MARKKQYFIYIPGLGDFYDPARRAFLATWSLRHRVQVDLIPTHWIEANETAEQKQQRILSLIEDAPRDREIILVGESAGGSLAISMLSICPDKIARVVTLCGKNTNSHNISPQLLKNNPAFKTAVRLSERTVGNMDESVRAKIHTIYSPLDNVVTKQNTLIPGARSTAVNTPGHQISIVLISLFRFRAIRS